MRTRRSRRSATPGWPASAARDLFRLESALACGPRPADEALRTLDALLPENPHPSAAAGARLAADHARPLRRGSPARERGRPSAGASSPATTGSTSCSATSRRPPATTRRAAVHLRRYCDLLEARGQRGFLSDLRAAARPLALHARPPRRGRAARPARPRRSTRRAGRLSRRRSGGRCRRSSTPAAANTPRRSTLAREAVAITRTAPTR